MLTLTIRNVNADKLRETINAMQAGLRLMTKRRAWVRWVDGWARSTEVTYSSKQKNMHPHIHVLLHFKPGYDKHIAQHEFTEMWQACLGIDYKPIVDIRRCYERTPTTTEFWKRTLGVALEGLKYATKPASLKAMPDPVLFEYARQLARLRLVAYGGSIKQGLKVLGLTKHAEESGESGTEGAMIAECPKCASAALVNVILEWSEAGGEYFLRSM